MNRKLRKGLKIGGLTVGALVLSMVVTVGGYLVYVIGNYSRIPDDQGLIVFGLNTQTIQDSDLYDDSIPTSGTTFSASTYNIGFGAYDRAYDFFMDENDYKPEYVSSHGGVAHTVGSHSRAASADAALHNTEGAVHTIVDLEQDYGKPVDFALFQEVDTNSDRSFHVNQLQNMANEFTTYDYVHAVNFHSSYLAYPLNEPIGKINSGISTFSRYSIESSVRKSFYVTDAFPTKFFDLDRCYSISKIPVGTTGKYLSIINVHLSAYDATGEIRARQFNELKGTLAAEFSAGNYVLVGGDFNHDVIYDNPAFASNGIYINPAAQPDWYDNYEQERPEDYWWNYLRLDPSDPDYDLEGTGMTIAAADNIPTCRDPSIPWQDENNNGILDNFLCTIDGFLVSPNLEVLKVENIAAGDDADNLGFAYSDHNPAYIEFKLKS